MIYSFLTMLTFLYCHFFLCQAFAFPRKPVIVPTTTMMKLRWRSHANIDRSSTITLMQSDDRSSSYSNEGTITVRFINTPSGKDVIAERVEIGSSLLAVSDTVGIGLPRACRTGLCGSCTCDVQDPFVVETATEGSRPGFVTVRACSSRCYVPENMTEMVVDVHRMRKIRQSRSRRNELDEEARKIQDEKDAEEEYNDAYSFKDPMARFGDNWEIDFKPLWELEKMRAESPIEQDPRKLSKACRHCNSLGRVMCYACSGTGKVEMGDGRTIPCPTCVGLRSVGCAYCQTTGFMMKAKKI